MPSNLSLTRAPVETTFPAYLNTVFRHHCPYLRPAQEANVLNIVDASTTTMVVEDIAGFACLQTELLRIRRASGPARNLNCTILALPKIPAGIVSRVHFLLKTLFTVKGLLFGKFWPGQGLVGSNGMSVIDPPGPILVIRSAMQRADLSFFEGKSLPFRSDFLNAYDDGSVVVGPFLRISAEQLVDRIQELGAKQDVSATLELSRITYDGDALLAEIHKKALPNDR